MKRFGKHVRFQSMRKPSFLIVILSGAAMFLINCFYFFNWYRFEDAHIANNKWLYLFAAFNSFGSVILLSAATVIRPVSAYLPFSIVLCINVAFFCFQGGVGLGGKEIFYYGWPMDWLQVSTTRTWFNDQVTIARHVTIDWYKFILSWLTFLVICQFFCWPKIAGWLKTRKRVSN